jgi:predicted PurR-regulated permease PerM
VTTGETTDDTADPGGSPQRRSRLSSALHVTSKAWKAPAHHPRGPGPRGDANGLGARPDQRASQEPPAEAEHGSEGPARPVSPSHAPTFIDAGLVEEVRAEAGEASVESFEEVLEHAGDDSPFGRLGPRLSRSPFVLGFTFALGALLAYALYKAVGEVRSALVNIGIAMFLAIGLNPAVVALEKRGIRRGAGVFIVFFGIILVFGLFGLAILPTLINEIISLVQNTPSLIDNLQHNHQIQDLDDKYHFLDKLQSGLTSTSLFQNVVGGVVGAASLIASTIFTFLTILILTLYFLASFPAIKELFYHLAPASRRPRVRALSDEILARAGGYVLGQLAVVICAGLSTYIALLILGARYAAALALVILVFDLIPMVGASIGSVVVSLIVAIQSWQMGLTMFVFFVVYQQIENYLIYPRIMKRAVNVHPAAAIVGALVGGGLLGFIGAILAIPTVAAIQLILEEVVLPRQERN